jgi:hypothetical protein
MENLVWIVYFVSKLEALIAFSWVGVIGFLLAFMIKTINLAESKSTQESFGGEELQIEYWENFGTKRFLIPAGFLALVGLALPSEDSAMRILAVYGGVELINNEEVQKIGGKGLEVLNKVMDEYLEGS